MKRLPRDQEKELADQARLLKAWRAWHAEQLANAIAGTHGTIIAELMTLLDRLELNSAAALLDFMRRSDWSSVSYDTRLTVLHHINDRITRRRAAQSPSHRLYEVLRTMHHGAALRLHDDGWALSTGMLVDADIANVLITGPRIAPVDYALFAETPAQTWRWVGTDLVCVK